MYFIVVLLSSDFRIWIKVVNLQYGSYFHKAYLNHGMPRLSLHVYLIQSHYLLITLNQSKLPHPSSFSYWIERTHWPTEYQMSNDLT